MNAKPKSQALNRLRQQVEASKAAQHPDGVGADDTLIRTARAIFNEQISEFPLPAAEGRPAMVVTFQHAKMRHLEPTMQFFERISMSLDPSILTEIVSMISERQIKALSEGKPANAFDITGLGTEEIISKALGKTTLFLAIMRAVTRELPTLAPVFTNLTAEQFGELDVDEGSVVALGIFVTNYRFFTRNLLPTLMDFIASVARKNAEITK